MYIFVGILNPNCIYSNTSLTVGIHVLKCSTNGVVVLPCATRRYLLYNRSCFVFTLNIVAIEFHFLVDHV